jgi:hypothetical protein
MPSLSDMQKQTPISKLGIPSLKHNLSSTKQSKTLPTRVCIYLAETVQPEFVQFKGAQAKSAYIWGEAYPEDQLVQGLETAYSFIQLFNPSLYLSC